MGGRSSRLQKQIFPRSKTKFEALQDKLTGNNQSYPSVPASSQQVKVDPEYTPQYSDLLKNVAGNIQSANDNFKFKNFSMNVAAPQAVTAAVIPPGYLDREALTRMFITEKGTPNLHERFGLTSEELDKIFSCYTGYKMKRKENNEFIEEVIKDRNEPPHRVAMSSVLTSQVTREHETARLKKEAKSGPSIHRGIEKELDT